MMKKFLLMGLLLPILLCGVVNASSPIWLNPTMTSNSAPYGVASASSEYGTFYAYLAFDHVTNTYGWTTQSTTGWLQYKFQKTGSVDTKAIITVYNITSNPDSTSRNPKDWTIQASNTGAFSGEQVTLDTRSNQTSWGASERRTYSFTNTNGYYYYRMVITANNGDATYIQFAELEWWGEYEPLVASFTKNQTSCMEPCTVAFTDTSTGAPTAWSYSSIDTSGNNTATIFSTLQNPITIFGTGTHRILLNASSGLQFNQSTQNTWVNVTPSSLTADFSHSPDPGNAGFAVSFTDLTSNSPTSWDWNFGDSTANVTLQNPAHTFVSRGNYTVSLIASNGYYTSSVSKTIQIIGLEDHQPVVVTNPYVVVYMWQRIA